MTTNRLASEKSPYLLQHATNPVDWFPWGEEAFAKAATEDKPVFLSIGYSTCHWCHVMERESFEDSEVASLLNEHFVCIKVDREERPDIDSVYMTACQIMTGQGGWPLSIMLTPDKKPFFAGTYFPKETLDSRIGMLDLVPRVAELWNTRREDLASSGDKVADALASLERAAHKGKDLTEAALFTAEQQLAERYDPANGGFGSAPKFPTPHNLMFLLRMYRRTGNQKNLDMVENTLRQMRMGGLYDHIGYGFHRYSTDETWLLPHFEKMLYDQAQLIMAYTETYQLTRKREYRRTAEEIIDYVLRDLRHPEGAFYCAEDADSEGEEGRFYVWSGHELRTALGKDAETFEHAYNVRGEGNFLEEATGRRNGQNVLHLSKPVATVAQELKTSELALETLLSDQRRLLFHLREKRTRPHLDDKVLTDWNGLMIAALAKAGRAFGEAAHLQAAKECADFLLRRMRTSQGLAHRFRDGEAGLPPVQTDYAFLAWGLCELYQGVFDPAYLQAALDLVDEMNGRFWDEGGAYFYTPQDGEQLLVRQKDFFDGALPSGNSVAMLVLLTLSRLTGRPDYAARAAAIARVGAAHAGKHPVGFTQLMIGQDTAIGPSVEIVIVGRRGEKSTEALLTAVNSAYLPHATVLLRQPGDAVIPSLAPFTKGLEMQNGKATAHVCRDFACGLAVTDPAALLEQLV